MSITILIVYYSATWTTFKPELKKLKKSVPKNILISQESELSYVFFKKICLVFWERNIQNPSTMKFSYIFGKEYSESWHNGTFLYFWKWSFRPSYFSYIWESNFRSPNKKKWSEKSSCISGNRTFLYFLKKRFFYISGEEYSEP